MYNIVLHKQPTNYYKKCPDPIARRLNKCFSRLQEDPFGAGTKKLEGELKEFRRIRTGAIRVVYRVDENKREVRIIAVFALGVMFIKDSNTSQP